MNSITVYTTPTWPWCHKVKAYLNEHNIAFNEVNVQSNYEGAREMIQKSGQRSVPVIDIDGNIIVGYDEPSIARLLNLWQFENAPAAGFVIVYKRIWSINKLM